MKGFLISLTAACFAVFAIAYIYIPEAIVYWDEAVYITWIYKLYLTLQKSDLSGLISIIEAQYLYPPVQSILTGFILVPFSFSIYAARISNLLWFITSSILLYAISYDIYPKKSSKETVSFLSVIFFILSPICIFFSSLLFKELLGLTWTLAVVYAYIKARKTQSLFIYFLAGCAVFVLTMTKYNYGGFVIVPLGIESIIAVIRSKKKIQSIIRHGLLWSVFIVGFGTWGVLQGTRLLDEYFLKTDWFTLTKDITDVKDILLFYPLSFIYFYSPSRLLGILMLGGFMYSLKKIRVYSYRILILIVLFNSIFQISIFPYNLQERYIFTTAPLIFICSAHMLYDILIRISRYTQQKILLSKICKASGVLFSIYVLWNMYQLPTYVYQVGAYVCKSPVFNQTDFVNDTNLWFTYTPSMWPKIIPSGTYEKPSDVLSYIASHTDLSKYVDVLGRSNEFSPPYVQLILDLHRAEKTYPSLPYTSHVVTIEILPESLYNTRDFRMYDAWTMESVRQAEQNPENILIDEHTFTQLAVRVKIFGTL